MKLNYYSAFLINISDCQFFVITKMDKKFGMLLKNEVKHVQIPPKVHTQRIIMRQKKELIMFLIFFKSKIGLVTRTYFIITLMCVASKI